MALPIYPKKIRLDTDVGGIVLCSHALFILILPSLHNRLPPQLHIFLLSPLKPHQNLQEAGVHHSRRRSHRRRNRRTYLRNRLKLPRRRPPHPALRPHPKPPMPQHLLRRPQPPLRPLHITRMHQPQIYLRIPQLQAPERQEVRLVIPVLRHRHVQPIHLPAHRLEDRRRQLDDQPRVTRLREVLVPDVAVAQVQAELHVRVHGGGEDAHALDDVGEDGVGVVAAIMSTQKTYRGGQHSRRAVRIIHALQRRDLARQVDLHRQVALVRHARLHAPQHLQQRRLVDRLERALPPVRHQAHDARGRRQADLEARARRDHALVPQLPELGVGGQGGGVVAGVDVLGEPGEGGAEGRFGDGWAGRRERPFADGVGDVGAQDSFALEGDEAVVVGCGFGEEGGRDLVV